MPRGRKFGSGDLQLLLLSLLGEQPAHGYQLIRQLEERSSGFYTPSPGMVYPALTYLDEAGLVESQADGNRKLYTLTESGRSGLAAGRAEADAMLELLGRMGRRMEHVRDAFAGVSGNDPGASEELLRARSGLKAALGRSRGCDADESRRLAAILDRATAEILRHDGRADAAPARPGPVRLRHEARRRTLQVLRVEQVSPHMRAVVLGGDLEGFVTAAPDDHVKLFFEGPDGTLAARDYTPRRFDAEKGELTIEFVLHGDGEGPASDWAARAVPGQSLTIGGPRGSTVQPAVDHLLLIGDQTALPAIGRWLEELPAGSRATALIEIGDAAEQRSLATRAEADIRWVIRDGAVAGRGGGLETALRSLPALQGQDVLAFVGCEIDTARRLKTILLEERGLARDRIKAAGYWRLGEQDGGGRLEE